MKYPDICDSPYASNVRILSPLDKLEIVDKLCRAIGIDRWEDNSVLKIASRIPVLLPSVRENIHEFGIKFESIFGRTGEVYCYEALQSGVQGVFACQKPVWIDHWDELCLLSSQDWVFFDESMRRFIILWHHGLLQGGILSDSILDASLFE